MSNCKEHKKEVCGVSDMKVLAEMICDLNYETLNELFKHLEVKFWIDGSRYYNDGREQFGTALQKASISMEDVAEYIRQAWEISRPFMKQ